MPEPIERVRNMNKMWRQLIIVQKSWHFLSIHSTTKLNRKQKLKQTNDVIVSYCIDLYVVTCCPMTLCTFYIILNSFCCCFLFVATIRIVNETCVCIWPVLSRFWKFLKLKIRSSHMKNGTRKCFHDFVCLVRHELSTDRICNRLIQWEIVIWRRRCRQTDVVVAALKRIGDDRNYIEITEQIYIQIKIKKEFERDRNRWNEKKR